MPLPDSIIIYPAHGAGSACGKNMMDLTKSVFPQGLMGKIFKDDLSSIQIRLLDILMSVKQTPSQQIEELISFFLNFEI